MKTDNLAASYKRLRAKYFFAGLCTFILTSLTLHWLIGYDADWGATNLILSIEASVAFSLFLVLADRQEEAQRKQLEYLLHLMEAQHALMNARSDSTSAVAATMADIECDSSSCGS